MVVDHSLFAYYLLIILRNHAKHCRRSMIVVAMVQALVEASILLKCDHEDANINVIVKIYEFKAGNRQQVECL